MIKQVSHTMSADSPAGVSLALAVAYEFHAPTEAVVAPTPAPRAPEEAMVAPAPAPRAPEVVPAPQLMGLRTSAARPHQRKVPLSRMTLVRG
ncbi:hypothetical protein [Streptomyces sp. Ag109_O5-10]|uniref:hypothetical protein n=1 Tax=Streptomyces sp. Ag109_O5-10 TaxID=1855349 RepID=UPI000897C8CD|nr:hypothetical protein [Streptomyces sp. Ag109_O5-10]SEE94824.1 hypothetical protein SAMN05216533_4588 [Streptomyces sp. Ag109_O5-10]